MDCPLLDPRSPLGLPPGPFPPKTERPQALMGKGRSWAVDSPISGRREVQRPNPRQVRLDFVPVSFLTTDDDDRRADFQRPARSADASSCCCFRSLLSRITV